MRRFLTLLILCAGVVTTPAQNTKTGTKTTTTTPASGKKAQTPPPPSAGTKAQIQAPRTAPGFAFPVGNVAGEYAANFGEMRPGHFHGGIDIKTDGAVGRPIIAAVQGSITRVTLSPSGYGRALYLTLPDGSTLVYGHLSRFRDDIEQRLEADRRKRRDNSADLRFAVGEYPAAQGEVIARSGNSGSSFGPHLHFELRDPAGRLTNIVRQGLVLPQDNIPPVIMRLHYIEVDTIQGVPIHGPRRSYNAVLTGGGRYRLQTETPVEAGRKGYFVLEASDRRNGVQNTFGLYRVSLAADADTLFEYRMDGIPAGLSRSCDAVSYYPLQVGSRNEVIRLAQLAEAPDCFYTAMRDRGLVRTLAGQTRQIRIEAEDDCGNRSSLEFDIRGSEATFHAQADSAATRLHPGRTATVRIGDELRAYIPAGALYEPLFCTPKTCPSAQVKTPAAILSPSYRIFERTTPLREAVTVSIRAFVPHDLQFRTGLAARSATGGLTFLGGKYSEGSVTATTRTTGEMLVAADTIAPRITPLFKEGADLSASSELRFRISDEFSGIGNYILEIDGQWVPCDRFPMKGTLVHTFATQATREAHQVSLSVTDVCGNFTLWRGTFYR